MGFLYGELLKAKEEIKVALNKNENTYQPIIDIIDSKAKDRLDSPLYLTAYILNPFYCHKDPWIAQQGDIMDGVCSCLEMFFPSDIDKQTNIMMTDLAKYTKKRVLLEK
ncbi:hypothetical protein Ddye_008698 [Dipteronia dyeriana]|uniref:Uncharacterized protein n=1 Tax=Dipteronia dyeriana TaxID=168575 RepID=A0AAE0CLL8_9ROSI|nr:hypothetical protein Ddye_008698 [Dipteronia dyeriana]